MKLGFTTLITENIVDSVQFYTEILGFNITKEFEPNPGTKIAFLENDGNRVELVQAAMLPPVDNSKSSIALTFLIENMEETCNLLKKNNVVIVMEPITLPNGMHICQAKDPNGVTLSFVKEVH